MSTTSRFLCNAIRFSRSGPRLRSWLAVTLTVLLLYAWPSAVAQSAGGQPPLSLSKVATSDRAVVGDTLTYLLTLTNTGQSSLEGVVVEDRTPEGTACFGVSGPSGWAMSTPGKGQPGRAVWRAEKPLPPGQTVTLRFIVTVTSGGVGQIVNGEYSARAEGWDEPVGGPPVLTALDAPTPTLTRPPLPTVTPTQKPVAMATAQPGVTSPPSEVTPAPVRPTTRVSAPIPSTAPAQAKAPEGTKGAAALFIAIASLVVAVAAVCSLAALFFVAGRRKSGK